MTAHLGPNLMPMVHTDISLSDLDVQTSVPENGKNLVRLDANIFPAPVNPVLIRERMGHCSEVAIHRAIPSPALRLPPELVREIFIQCRPAIVLLPPDPTEVTLVLCQICSSWREIALGTSKLWANIILDFSRAATKITYRRFVRIAMAWLHCARVSPLRIHIRGVKCTPSRNPINALVIPYSHSLREIDLWLPFEYFAPFFQQRSGSLELLESLKITVNANLPPQYYPLWEETPVSVFYGAHRLREVTLTLNRNTLDLWSLHLPWSQLTQLHISTTCLVADGWHDAIHLCTSLVDYTMSHVTWKGEVIIKGGYIPVVPLHNLRVLKLVFSGLPFVDLFTPGPLVLPALEDLEIFETRVWTGLELAALRNHSFPNLQRLCLSSLDVSTPELVEFLRPMTSIVELNVVVQADHFLLNALSCSNPDAEHLVPKLEVLRLYHYQRTPLLDKLADMVESRWWPDTKSDSLRPVSRLRELRMRIGNIGPIVIDEGVRMRLQKCRSEGLVVTWTQIE